MHSYTQSLRWRLKGTTVKVRLLFSGRPTEGLEPLEHGLQECHRKGALYLATAADYGDPAALIMTGRPAEGTAMLPYVAA